MKVGALAARARAALGEALELAQPGTRFDARGYAVEADGTTRAPWSSSALAVGSFAPWQRDTRLFSLARLTGFDAGLEFDAECPNGVSSVPPKLDVLLERGEDILAVESKCTEYLASKTPEVSRAYLRLAHQHDARAASRWFAALAAVPEFQLLDAYQLVKHYLGLRLTYPGRPLTLTYLFWEPADAESHPLLGTHRSEIRQFADLVAGDTTCRFAALSYAEHWDALDRLPVKPEWLPAHLRALRARYSVPV
jgi:hypothetical protein